MFLAQAIASCPPPLAAVQPVCTRAESFWEAAFTARMVALGSSCGGVSGAAVCFSFDFEMVSLEASWRVRSSTSSDFFVVLTVLVPAARLNFEAFGGI